MFHQLSGEVPGFDWESSFFEVPGHEAVGGHHEAVRRFLEGASSHPFMTWETFDSFAWI